MFTQVLTPVHEQNNDNNNNSSSSSPWCIRRILHYGGITILSICTTLIFLQTQAISLQLARQQREIDSLQSQLHNTSEHIQHEVEAQRDFTVLHMAGTFTLKHVWWHSSTWPIICAKWINPPFNARYSRYYGCPRSTGLPPSFVSYYQKERDI